MANTVNAALKPLETLSRIVNQPSSLFGGKGGSSKNKTEHDTVGTTRDSNSNTQDQGSPLYLRSRLLDGGGDTEGGCLCREITRMKSNASHEFSEMFKQDTQQKKNCFGNL